MCVDKTADAVGTLITERPPHRTVRAAFPHTACMGLSLSSDINTIFVVLCHSILLFDPRREHSFVPTAYFHRRLRAAAVKDGACLGLSLSSDINTIFVVLCHSILLFDPRREHSFVPTAYFHRRLRAAAVKDGASSAPPKACP